MQLKWPALIALLLLIAGIAGGLFWLLGDSTSESTKGGGESTSREDAAEAERLEALKTVPYLNVSEERADGAASGVRVHRTDRVAPGYNLYCSRLSPEAFLVDMDGREVHRWSHGDGSAIWDWVELLPDGRLLVIESFKRLLLLDRDSNLVWKKRIRAHHDVIVDPEDPTSIWVAVREVKRHRGAKVRFPVIQRLALEDGKILETWRAHDHLDELERVLDTTWFLDTLLDQGDDPKESLMGGRELRRYDFDYFHLNTIQILPDTELGRRDPRFAAGNLLVCFRNVNQIVILERGTFRPLWAWGEGELERPHYPVLLPEGKILVYDNGYWRGSSRVLELDPVGGEITWSYQADPPRRFFSPTKGSAQRLPGGTTLITESSRGRVFEIERDGTIVWEWLNPRLKNDRRAQVYRMLRQPASRVEGWLGRVGG